MAGDLVEEVGRSLSTLVVSTFNEEQKVRVGALFAARSVAPQAAVWDQIHLADFIINGLAPSSDLPGLDPLTSGGTVGPDPAFLPDKDDGDPGPQPPAGDEDPDAWKDEPAPSAGTQWVGRRGH